MQSAPRVGVAAVAAALIAVSAGSIPAGAAQGGSASFTVSGGPPGPIPIGPGSQVQQTFTVDNTSSIQETIHVQVTGLSFNGDTPQFTGSPSPNLAVSATPAQLPLAPGARQDVKVSLTASPSARPGGLYAGVVFSDVPPSQSGQVNVVTAQARPLIGHVPGPTVDSGRITAFQQAAGGSAVSLQASFLDTGDIDYQISGTMSVSAPTGPVGSVPVGPRLVLPGNPRTFAIPFSLPPGTSVPPGPYTADLHLVWGVSGEHSGDARSPVQISSTTVPAGNLHPSGQASLPPTFIGRPLTHHTPSAHTRSAHHVGWTDWLVRGIDLLLLLLALLLLAIATREREEYKKLQARPVTTDW